MKRNHGIVVGTMCVALVGLMGCGRKPSDSGDGKPGVQTVSVGFSQIGAESAWRTANTKSIKDEAAARGIRLVFSDAQQKQENQIKALRSFVAQGVDVIAFSPVVETGWEPVLREIKLAGIPVVLSDRAVDVSDDDLFATFIGPDSVEEGRQAATWLAEKTGGKAVIAELVGTPGSAPAIDRKAGFEEVLAGHPDYEVTGGSVTFEVNREVQDLLAMEAHERACAGVFLAFQYPVEVPGVSNTVFLRAAFNAICRAQGVPPVDAFDFQDLLTEKLALIGMDKSYLDRPVNLDFSGGEKKRN